MSVRCGHCKQQHDTLQEVKDCALLGTPVTQQQFDTHAEAALAPPGIITGPQLDYLRKLVQERPMWADVENLHMDVLPTLTKAQASSKIAEALKVPKETTVKVNGNGGNGGALADIGVPEGYYAIPSATGNNDLDFYAVQAGKGKWEGRLFVNRVIGGHSDTPVRNKEAVEALKRIKDHGIEDARMTYAMELGRCYVCNRHLTDELSRQLGIGPVCRAGGGGED